MLLKAVILCVMFAYIQIAPCLLYNESRESAPEQSLIVIACKLLCVIYTILKTGKKYDPEKLLKDIRYLEKVQSVGA
mgnify:CR=1 FL=1